MEIDSLSQSEKDLLLQNAREAIESAVRKIKPKPLDIKVVPVRLQQWGASFVTLTAAGNLRGCIGTLQPYQPLIDDVREHAAAAALEDYRFPPVQPDELAGIHIEISRLTVPQPLQYSRPEDLLVSLRPRVDGVILRDGLQRATFLPQVWEKIPEPADFLGNLCYKMGAPQDLWRRKHLDVSVYQVEEFQEDA